LANIVLNVVRVAADVGTSLAKLTHAASRPLAKVGRHRAVVPPSGTPPELEPELDPELEPELDPELEPELDPELEPELDPELEPELDPELEPDPELELAEPELDPDELDPELEPEPEELDPELEPEPEEPEPEPEPELELEKPESSPDVEPQAASIQTPTARAKREEARSAILSRLSVGEEGSKPGSNHGSSGPRTSQRLSFRSRLICARVL